MAGNIPLLIRVLPSCNALSRTNSYKLFIIIFTFFIYTSFHLSRKPISIVKSVLHQKNCSVPLYPGGPHSNGTDCDWGPFNHGNFASLLGWLDNAYLMAYALGMFCSGHLAERMNLRYFLTMGMLGSGIMTAAFGFGYFFDIHQFWFYIVVQTIGGFLQSSGWPSVVTCMGNWYGKGKRGLIMGIWNSHTSVGNILGSLIAGIWVNHAWGWSFVVPGIIIGSLGIISFFTLVTEPSIVGCDEPQQQLPEEINNEVHSHHNEVVDQPLHGVINSSSSVESGKKPLPEEPEVNVTDLPAIMQVKSEVPPAEINGVINKAFSASELDISPMRRNESRDVLIELNNLEKNHAAHNEEVPHLTQNAAASQNGIAVKPKGKNESTQLLKPTNRGSDKAISFIRALLIPGVLEFSLCLFCAKLVSYTFLFWLPKYISVKTDYNAERSGDLSTLFDVGGILGGIAAGLISDFTGARASTCCLMLILAAPMMFIYNVFGSVSFANSVGLLLLCGFMVNGPYALITTAVSADLGTHRSLQGNTKALATVTAIIDGTGSIGAAIGPLLTGIISPHGWNNVFWMLIAADLFAMVFLTRLVYKEVSAKFWPRETVIEVNS